MTNSLTGCQWTSRESREEHPETHDSELTKLRKRTAGSAMSTSGSSIADEVELPEDLSGSVDIEHDVVVSGDVDASEGTAEMGTGEAAAEETARDARDEGPMRPDLIVGPPPEPDLPIEDDTSVGDRSSEEEAYSDEFYEEDAVPEKEEPEPPVAEKSDASQGPSGGDATATRDDTYGDDFEEYGGGDEDGDDDEERSTPSPLARDPPTSPASQPLRSLGTPGSSPRRRRFPFPAGSTTEPEPDAARRLGARGRRHRGRRGRRHERRRPRRRRRRRR